MIEVAGGVGEAGADVPGFKVGKIGEDFLRRGPIGEHVEHIFDADAHPADAWASATLAGIDGDAIHAASVARGGALCQCQRPRPQRLRVASNKMTPGESRRVGGKGVVAPTKA